MAILQQQRQGLTPLPRKKLRYIHDHQHDQIMMSLLQAVADIVRTTLGPRAMLKMLLDASGGTPELLSSAVMPAYLLAAANPIGVQPGRSLLIWLKEHPHKITH